MDICVLALDLDGTLLTDHNFISPACCDAVQKARKKGVQAVICTGRNFADSKMFATQAGGMDWAITGNGAEIRSLPDGKVLFTQTLGLELCQAALQISGEFGCDPCFYTSAGVFYGHSFEDFVQNCAAHGMTLNFQERENYHRIPEDGWQAFLDAQAGEIQKAILHAADPALIDAMCARVQEDGRFEAAPSVMFGGQLKNVELNRRGVSKGQALSMLAERLGIPMQQIMAIGDSDNDLSMLRMAGTGVAMGDSPAHIRAAADAVTASNAQDGVARAVETFIL